MAEPEATHGANEAVQRTTDDSLKLAETGKKSPEKQLDADVAKVLSKYEQEFKKADEKNDDKAAEAVVEKAAKDLDATLKANPKLADQLPADFKKIFEDVFVYFDKSGNQVPWGFKVEKKDGQLQATYMITGPVGGGNVPLSP